MGEKQSTRDQAAVAPGRDIWAEDFNPAGRDADGGGYGRQAQAHLAADGLQHGADRPDPIAKPAPGGTPDSWWEHGLHTSG
jgi:hypothetical protein